MLIPALRGGRHCILLLQGTTGDAQVNASPWLQAPAFECPMPLFTAAAKPLLCQMR